MSIRAPYFFRTYLITEKTTLYHLITILLPGNLLAHTVLRQHFRLELLSYRYCLPAELQKYCFHR